MHDFSIQNHNAFIEQKAQKEYGWDDWLNDYPGFVQPRAYYGRRVRSKRAVKRPQEINSMEASPMENRSFRLNDHRKGRI